VVAVVLLQSALNLIVGATIALAAHRRDEVLRLWQQPAGWVLLLFELLLAVPLAAYLLYRYPAFASAYLLGQVTLGRAVSYATIASVTPAIGAFCACQQVLRRQRPAVALALLAAFAVLAGVVAFLLRHRLAVVGSLAAFSAGRARPILNSPLPFFLPAWELAFLFGWGATLWRLVAIRRAGSRHGAQVPRGKGHAGTQIIPSAAGRHHERR
jgi:hypothetical protein